MRLITLTFLGSALAFALGCAGLGGKDDGDDAPGLLEDQDGDNDGFDYGEDCDDDDARVNPDAKEICDDDDVDEDCNGSSDNADAGLEGGYIVYHDADGDGYGNADEQTVACEVTAGYSLKAGDCDDGDASAFPYATEICDAANVDEDCNGAADDADPGVEPSGMTEYLRDADGDGYGDEGVTTTACDAPSGWQVSGGDCDDLDGAIHPDAVEMCNGLDDDCDGRADDASAADIGTWYADADADGYGDADAVREACDQPDGFVSDATDCDDTRASTYPGANEYCDDEDDDCDGSTDEDDAVDVRTFYLDADHDGWGTSTTSDIDCDQPFNYVPDAGDCNDGAASVSPSANEVCDSADTDEDCDGLTDNDDGSAASSGKTTWYADDDGDTYGDADSTTRTCDMPAGYVSNDDDCDDTSSSISPAGSEICDADDEDEDCDGNSDDDDTSVAAAGKTTYYRDADGDGYGVTTSTTSKCDLPASGYSAYSTDCDDSTSARSPGKTEVCDSADLDEDCDSLADDSDASVTGTTTYYLDADADGYGTSATTLARCTQPSGYATTSTDCNDADATVSPGDTEICADGVDQTCDGYDQCDETEVTLGARQIVGETAGDNAGFVVANAGDVDADGYDDLLVGAYNNDAGGSTSGSAYLVEYGTSTLDLSASTAIFIGEDASDYAGYSVAGVGDVNGDGRDDIAIGAIGDDDGGSAAGKVYVLRGALSGSYDLSTAYSKLVGESASDNAGISVSGGGDVDGDGDDDVIVGASGRSSNAGAAYLITDPASGTTDLSAADAILTGESSSDYAGFSVASGCDTDGDGYGDFLVGAYGDDDSYSNGGAVYLITGPVSGTKSLSTYDAKIRGISTSQALGKVTSCHGDVSGDGYDDILAGVTGYTYLFEGPLTGAVAASTYDARVTGTYMGASADIAGDLNDDGYAEIAIGGPGQSSSAGAVWVYFGPVSGSLTSVNAEYEITPVTGSYFGNAVSGAGDHDNDGYGDLLIGAYGDDDGGAEAGGAWFVSGGGM